MDLGGQRIALYGRILSRPRRDIVTQISALGGDVERDLTRRTTMLVVGRGSMNLIPSGHLARKLATAETQNTAVFGEDRFAEMLAGEKTPLPTYPLNRVTPAPADGLVSLLNAFDLVHATADACRFQDVKVLRTAVTLLGEGHEMSSLVRILTQARAAPPGRFRMLTNAAGEVRLDWGDTVTGLDGQGLLPLPDLPDLDDLFDAAMLAEAEGRLEQAALAYAMCAQLDRRDPIAPFNLANVLARQGQTAEAMTRLDQAIARDPGFAEAWFNRARLEEARGNHSKAKSDLAKSIIADASYGEALFNLAQLELQDGNPRAAVSLLDRFIALEPDAAWHGLAIKLLSVARAKGAPE